MTVTNNLPIIPHKIAIHRANEKIRESMTIAHPGLLCRWAKLNQVVGGHFRFGRIFTIAGASGSGKSYMLNMLRDDFAHKINDGYPRPYNILSFSLEMDAADEVIRSYSGNLGMSYEALLSAEEKISQTKFEEILNLSKTMVSTKIFFVEMSGNRDQMRSTVAHFNSMFPDAQLIITVDHTLLVEYLDEKSEVELVAHVAKFAMWAKKTYGALVILLGQLNDKIEHIERRSPEAKHLQYPTKTDIHGSKAVFMASDDVWIIHAPETLGLRYYGINDYPTHDLIALHVLKGRFSGRTGVIRFRNDFGKGNLIYPYDTITNQDF